MGLKSFFLAGTLAVGLACAGVAKAGTASANLNVSANVASTCGVIDSTLSFGSVTPSTGTVLPASGSVSVTCTLGTAFSVGLGNGTNASGSTRRMRQGTSSNYITYEIYQDLLTTTRFGDTGSTDRASGLGVGVLAVPVAFYGTIASGQTAPSGTYTDTVQINLYY